ncbi:MAG: M13 family peptidase, partial [Sinomicrobium sp.]|nr:M13 family peptidase [Sinomicrobium sp.]
MKIQMSKTTLAGLLTVLTVISCKKEKEADGEGTPGVNLAYMDNTVNPADDFFRYVNGGWLDHTEIPADRPRW